MPTMKPGPLIEAELETELDRFADWLKRGEESERRRRRKARSPLTADLYRERMGHLLRRCQALNPSVATLRREFLAWMKQPTRYGKPATNSTARRSYFAVKAWAQWRGLSLGDPREALEAFDVPPDPYNARSDESMLDLDTVRMLFMRLAEHGDRRNYAICRTLLRGGPRRRVIALTKVKNFDHAGRCITIPDEIAKGRRGGTFIVDPTTADAIRDYLKGRWDRGENPEAPLFHSYLTHGHLTPTAVTKLVAKLTERALGADGRRTPHELRHIFLTFAANGVEGEPMPVAQLMRQAQHSRASTTMRYLHPTGDPRAAYDRAMGLA